MTRSGSKNLSSQWSPNQSQIAHYIQKFMSCRFVAVAKFDVVENSFFSNFNFGLIEHFGQMSQLFFFYYSIYYYDGII